MLCLPASVHASRAPIPAFGARLSMNGDYDLVFTSVLAFSLYSSACSAMIILGLVSLFRMKIQDAFDHLLFVRQLM